MLLIIKDSLFTGEHSYYVGVCGVGLWSGSLSSFLYSSSSFFPFIAGKEKGA